MAQGFHEGSASFVAPSDRTARLVDLVAADQDALRLGFRETLIRLMAARRVTAGELARETGISKGTIDKLRQRKVEVTNAFDAMKIAMFFGMNVEQFFAVPEASVPKPERRGRHPLIGCMAGTITIMPGVDLTEPMFTDAEMDAFVEAKAKLINGIQP